MMKRGPAQKTMDALPPAVKKPYEAPGFPQRGAVRCELGDFRSAWPHSLNGSAVSGSDPGRPAIGNAEQDKWGFHPGKPFQAPRGVGVYLLSACARTRTSPSRVMR
jgi:hypothetical protein